MLPTSWMLLLVSETPRSLFLAYTSAHDYNQYPGTCPFETRRVVEEYTLTFGMTSSALSTLFVTAMLTIILEQADVFPGTLRSNQSLIYFAFGRRTLPKSELVHSTVEG